MQQRDLWLDLKQATARALARGALQPIRTRVVQVEDEGIPFLVHVVENRPERPAALDESRAERLRNPFLPYDPDLFVADIAPRHVGLLNKYPVVIHHLLIVTRAYEDQESPLTRADFAALWSSLAAFDGLAFYNAGRVAGASQPHKHLQIVPLPLAASGAAVPIQPWIESATFDDGIGRIEALPFAHALVRADPAWLAGSPGAGAFCAYQELRHAVGLEEGPYNLLATRDWLLLVPRRRESLQSISINALGFAGALLARDDTELATIRRARPLALLRHTALPR